jgi:hypothetical protein
MAKGKNTVMASHGRAPWYTPDGKSIDAYVIGIGQLFQLLSISADGQLEEAPAARQASQGPSSPP